MKNIVKNLWVIVISTAIIFSMTGCGDGSSKSVSSSLGNTLALSSDKTFYLINGFYLGDLPAIAFNEYSGSVLTITEPASGEPGFIGADGKFDFVMGAPNVNLLVSASEIMEDISNGLYTDLKVSNEDIKAFSISGFNVSGSDYSNFSRMNDSTNYSNNESSITMTVNSAKVNYIWVDNNITVSASKASLPAGELGYPVPVTVNALNISLKKGWNITRTSITGSVSRFLSEDVSGSVTVSIATGDSDALRWVLD
ncbi:MAG: hypothetical protein FWC19_04665 [Treponema sp.]|nr:hypothetical protein [Treponema sp.]MCL2272083.1 hypothetical protein [Treponema sp.]